MTGGAASVSKPKRSPSPWSTSKMKVKVLFAKFSSQSKRKSSGWKKVSNRESNAGNLSRNPDGALKKKHDNSRKRKKEGGGGGSTSSVSDTKSDFSIFESLFKKESGSKKTSVNHGRSSSTTRNVNDFSSTSLQF